MNSALSSGLSGMLAHQQALDVSANNTANASTNGFRPAKAAFSEQAGGGVQAVATPSTLVTLSSQAAAKGGDNVAAAPSGTDLATEAVNSIAYRVGFDMSAKMVKTADQLLGTLIDAKA
ncbi:MAG: flagellar basal body protein [Rhodocyclaceae bacterium]|nr:flagellar basal body protein [Rhodocyclaceae bacterium]